MCTIQFKRILTSDKNLEDTIVALQTKLDPPLSDGEPLLCSYQEGNLRKFLIAIGTPSDTDNIRILPAFKNNEEINEFIATRSAGGNWIDEVSENSEITVTRDVNGKLLFNTKGWEILKDKTI